MTISQALALVREREEKNYILGRSEWTICFIT